MPDPCVRPRRGWNLKRGLIAKLLSVTGFGRVLAALPRRGVLVFNYHRVGDDAQSQPYDRALWSASAGDFDVLEDPALTQFRRQLRSISSSEPPHSQTSSRRLG